jgi:hypothetical protein
MNKYRSLVLGRSPRQHAGPDHAPRTRSPIVARRESRALNVCMAHAPWLREFTPRNPPFARGGQKAGFSRSLSPPTKGGFRGVLRSRFRVYATQPFGALGLIIHEPDPSASASQDSPVLTRWRVELGSGVRHSTARRSQWNRAKGKADRRVAGRSRLVQKRQVRSSSWRRLLRPPIFAFPMTRIDWVALAAKVCVALSRLCLGWATELRGFARADMFGPFQGQNPPEAGPSPVVFAGKSPFSLARRCVCSARWPPGYRIRGSNPGQSWPRDPLW